LIIRAVLIVIEETSHTLWSPPFTSVGLSWILWLPSFLALQ